MEVGLVLLKGFEMIAMWSTYKNFYSHFAANRITGVALGMVVGVFPDELTFVQIETGYNDCYRQFSGVMLLDLDQPVYRAGICRCEKEWLTQRAHTAVHYGGEYEYWSVMISIMYAELQAANFLWGEYH